MMCEVLAVSRSGLYQAMRRSARAASHEEEQRIVEQIRRAQRKHRGRCGRRRMTPELSEELGQRLNHKRIDRLMREHGLCGRKRQPFRVVTTDSRHDHPIAPNVLGRDFVATAPLQKRGGPLLAGMLRCRRCGRKLTASYTDTRDCNRRLAP
jgi:hypothetical protein